MKAAIPGLALLMLAACGGNDGRQADQAVEQGVVRSVADVEAAQAAVDAAPVAVANEKGAIAGGNG